MFQVAALASVTLVSLTPFIVNEVKRPAFPLGVNVFFGVALRDKMGRLFDVSNVPLKHRASRLVEISCFLLRYFESSFDVEFCHARIAKQNPPAVTRVLSLIKFELDIIQQVYSFNIFRIKLCKVVTR